MTSEEKKESQSIIPTLADPVGNWPFAWEQLCEIADLDLNHYLPHFKPHPILGVRKVLPHESDFSR